MHAAPWSLPSDQNRRVDVCMKYRARAKREVRNTDLTRSDFGKQPFQFPHDSPFHTDADPNSQGLCD